MKYLLDTHTFLWSLAQSNLLSERARSEIKNPKNDIFISSVNLWEIAIKVRLKKMDIGGISTDNLIGLAEDMDIQLIGLTPEEAITYGKLEENSHFNPFDRMLIWQAISRKYAIISKDAKFKKFIPHGLQLIWE